MKRIYSLLMFIVVAFTGVFAQGYNVGDIASDFRLQNVNGDFVMLADYPDAKGFIVVFTCNHCPYAVAYEDRLIELDGKYKGAGFPVIAINPNDPQVQPKDSYDEMKKRAGEKHFSFPYLFDEGQKVYPVYGASRTPHVYLLERTAGGNIVRYIGAIDDNYEDASAVTKHYVADAIDAILKGEIFEPVFTKAIGCTIKTK